ncbi:hypothetical protein ACFJIW_18455 [Tahibacter sp. UC22_41]|uniref:hypothetical protein n=1 Tax=Tahibacter sp. UC22_41 TaxID=3350178 RepID=UPI0036DC19FD
MSSPWQLLGLTQTAGVREVRSRYAELLKHNRPEDDPPGFQRLRQAYEVCLDAARQRERGAEDVAVTVAAPPLAPIPPYPAHETAVEPAVGSVRRPVAMPVPVPRVELPQLRDPSLVAAALLSLDRGTPQTSDAFAREFGECPELTSFVTRHHVELELLRRITDGARPTLRALRLFGSTFGWRQLGHERHLLQLGVPHEALPRIDEALFRAGCEAQFEWHLETRRQRIPPNQGSDAEDELRLLEALHAQRGTPPRLGELLSSARARQVNEVLGAWTKAYGPAATGYLFGKANIARWQQLDPGAEPNPLQALSVGLTYARYVGLAIASLVCSGLGLMSGPFAGRVQTVGSMLPAILIIAAVLVAVLAGGPYALRRLRHAVDGIDANHARWRQRHVAPWLTPPRAIPLLATFGALLAFAVRHDEWPGAMAGIAGIAIVAFGWRSLALLVLDAGFVWGCTVIWTGNDSAVPVIVAAAAALPLLWASDRLACRLAPQMGDGLRWWRLLGVSFALGVIALFALVFLVVNLR